MAHFRDSTSGSTGVVFALALPVILAGVGAATDYTSMAAQRSKMQVAADAAAIAATQELRVSANSAERVNVTARGVALARLASEGSAGSVAVRAEIVAERSVRVTIEQAAPAYFTGFLAAPTLSVAATGTLSGGRGPVCVITLDLSASQAMELKSSAWLQARNCSVFSNSSSPSSIRTDSGITIDAALTCSAGGFTGNGQIRGERKTDCPSVPDPLAGRPAPTIGKCDFYNKRIEKEGTKVKRVKLKPGVYCGGIFISADSVVEFDKGVFIIKDGPFTIDGNADVKGKHVGFYLAGADAVFNFASNSRVDLDGHDQGPMAGLLFFEDRAAPLLREHRITSNFATNLTGTVYLSRGRFVVDATNDVAAGSAYTVIIARQLLLSAAPRLTLNTSYHETDVPVPDGVAGTTGTARLSN